MSVRKISELPFIDATSKDEKPYLMESLMEVSRSNYSHTEDSYWFVSKHIKYGDMVSAIIHEITYGPDDGGGTVFYTSVYFYEPVYFYKGVEISGNFYLNKDLDDSELINYEFYSRVNKHTLYSVSETILSAPAINAYTNAFTINTFGGTPVQIARFDNQNISLRRNTYVGGSLTVTGNTTLNGNLNCYGVATFTKDIQGCAVRARWADLAEGYETDDIYEPGTFVQFGGEKELTIATTEANAVITTKPGFVLGADDRVGNIQEIALIGRTPVKVVGTVKKFDRLVLSDIPGVAQAQKNNKDKQVVARSLENIIQGENDIGLVEAVVQLQL